jgi:agmatine/peptidylarginine deiminase
MAWAVHEEWRAHADEVKRELREIIATVAEYEEVILAVPRKREMSQYCAVIAVFIT